MKKIISILMVLSVAVTLVFAAGQGETSGYKIGISKLLPHPALDAVEKGVLDYFAASDTEATFLTQNANNEISNAAAIAQQFKDQRCDIVLGIATPTAQSLANVFADIPVVFSAVTDPSSADLVGNNICGVSDANPVKSQVELFVEVTGAEVLGNIYANGEANGVFLNSEIQKACDELGVELVSAAVTNTSEVKLAAQGIIDRVDAIFVATDNTVISALASVADVCNAAMKPLFSSDPTATEGLECLLAWGFNYYNLGLKTGEVIERALKGEDPASIGTVMLTDPKDFELYINNTNAKKLGITIQQDLLDSAKEVL